MSNNTDQVPQESATDFHSFGLLPELIEALGYMGFKKPTPIQIQAIPAVMANRDLIACAQTGTGKTGAFLLPILNSILKRNDSISGIKALIVVPTRELAVQIDRQIEGMAYGTSITSMAIYGGGDGDGWTIQKKALIEGVDIVVATPGKLISHLNMGYVNFNTVRFAVLDEADRMLDIGFYEDVIKISGFLPDTAQKLMFSATMPHKIRELAKLILKNPFEISLAISKPAEGVSQGAYLVYDDNKDRLLRSIIEDRKHYDSILVFSSTKSAVHRLVRALKKVEIRTEGISSDLEQAERESVLASFSAKRCRILVATDVVSRGIDIKDINLVINFNVPADPEDYVHRIGRTARASTKGEAITFINTDEMGRFGRIEKLIDREIVKNLTPEHIGPSPEWSLKRPASSGSSNGNQNRRPFFKNQNRNRPA